MVPAERLNPVSEYWHPDRHAQERDILLRTLPLVVGYSSQLMPGGEPVVERLSGWDVRLTRATDGLVRGWLPGRLTGELTEVPVQERHAMVWAVLTPGAPIDVAGYLGAALDAEFTEFGLERYVVERTHRFDERINWKSVIDGFLENYHVRYLHGATLARYLRTNVHVYDAFERHARLAVVKTTFDKVRHLPASEYDPLKHMSVVYHLFPNTVISWVNDHFESWTSFPDPERPGRSATQMTLLTRPEDAARHDFWDRSMRTILEVIPAEDFEMSRRMQDGLRAGAQTHQVFGRNEGPLQQFHAQLEAVLGPAPSA
jgi:phenylpropionate dioxygenase-like ring-hydroxylating dioxygenase large terminal subunit